MPADRQTSSEPTAGAPTSPRTRVNLDPHHTQEATVSLDIPELGPEWPESVPVRDELAGETYHWGRANHMCLEPGSTPAHLLVLRASPPIGGSPTS